MKGYDLRMKGDELRKEIVQTIHDLLTDNNIKEFDLSDEYIAVSVLMDNGRRTVMDITCVYPEDDTLYYEAANEDGDVSMDHECDHKRFTIDLDSLTVILMRIEEYVEEMGHYTCPVEMFQNPIQPFNMN